MGIGVSLFLLAVGAILTFAVEVNAEGFNINTIGIILMIVGGLGLAPHDAVLADTAPLGASPTRRVVREDREVL